MLEPVIAKYNVKKGLKLAFEEFDSSKVCVGLYEFLGEVIINHGNGYTTLYGHMLRFAKNIHKGTRVKQGQIIGFVGMTGLATGPHCHYEFRIHNKHRDPLKVKLPQGHTIAKSHRKKFFAHRDTLLKRLALYDQIEMAARNGREETST